MENLEREVIRRVLSGETDLYRLLMERHLPAVLRMTRRVTGCEEDAEETAQEAFLRAYNKLPAFREHAAFGTWVYRIAMNCALNLMQRRRRDVGWNAVELDGAAEAEGLVISRWPTPEADVLEAEAAGERERLLRCLTPMERTAFVLRHLEDQPVAVIAEALGINANTARQTIFRAVSKLRRELAPARPATGTRLSQTRMLKESQ
jgi:RNA polymerase sigma-70 factor (ECF subfamily)